MSLAVRGQRFWIGYYRFMILESPFTTPITLRVRPSQITLLFMLVPILLITALVFGYTAIDWLWLGLIGFFNLAVAYYFICLHYLQSLSHSVVMIEQGDHQQWLLQTVGSEFAEDAELLGNSFVSRYLLVLNFKGLKRHYTVILPASSFDADTFRRLRVRIKVAFS